MEATFDVEGGLLLVDLPAMSGGRVGEANLSFEVNFNKSATESTFEVVFASFGLSPWLFALSFAPGEFLMDDTRPLTFFNRSSSFPTVLFGE